MNNHIASWLRFPTQQAQIEEEAARTFNDTSPGGVSMRDRRVPLFRNQYGPLTDYLLRRRAFSTRQQK